MTGEEEKQFPRCACGKRGDLMWLDGEDIKCKFCGHVYRRQFCYSSLNAELAASAKTTG